VPQPDLYYANELNRLLDVDPAAPSNAKEIMFSDVEKIVAEHPNVCRAKYDLTFNGEKLHLYPLFSLVANNAPLELIRTVFIENPFRFVDVCDDYGQTILHYACAYKPLHIETLDYLIRRCPHILDAFDKKNRAPLHTACANISSVSETTILFILEHSPPHIAKVADCDGKLPLDLALMNPKCSSKLKASLTEGSKGIVSIPLNIKSPPAIVNGRSNVPQAKVTVSQVTINQAANGARPLNSSAPEPTPAPPTPSFWDLLCCRPVSW
jgi:ankyrin repeat protein